MRSPEFTSPFRVANTWRCRVLRAAASRRCCPSWACSIRPPAASYLLNSKPVENLSFGERSRIRNQEIGFIFQSFNLIGDLTVEENVELPLTYRAGMPSAERKKRVKEALERVNMAHRMRHYPAQLSGGQQQRVAVARALAGSPSILLADEPTGNLDSKNGEAVMHLLSDLHREGSTICMVTHDPRFAKHAEREVHLFDGKVVSEDELKKLTAEVEAYVMLVQSAIQDLRYAMRQLRHAPGFTLAAVLTLALGIASLTTVFTWIKVGDVRSLPACQRSARLRFVDATVRGSQGYSVHYDVWGFCATGTRASRIRRRSLSKCSTCPLRVLLPRRLPRGLVSSNYFQLLGTEAAGGALLHAGANDRVYGSHDEVVLSDREWRVRFNADPRIVGQVRLPSTAIRSRSWAWPRAILQGSTAESAK